MKRLLVNAVNLRLAGGLTVGLNFLKVLAEKHPDLEVVVLAPTGCGYEAFSSKKTTVHLLPKWLGLPPFRKILDHFWLKKIVRESQPEVIFSMGNIAAPITGIKQGVLFMHPYPIYPDEKAIWDLLTTKELFLTKALIRLFRSRIKYADVIFPQTTVSESRLHKYYPSIRKTVVIPTAYSTIQTANKGKDAIPNFLDRKPGNRYLLALTKYYVHKNLEILLPVAKRVKADRLPYRFITTFNPEQHPKARLLLETIEKEGLGDIIINLGNIPVGDVPYLYNKVDGLFMPTLLESFSATYADSLFLKKPIFTSDLDFARVVCEDCAFYFAPFSPESIVATITNAFENPHLIEQKVEAGYARSQSFPDWDEVAAMYISELTKLAASN